jgi:hypothetical protein
LADWHREGKSLQSATTANTIFYVYNPALITGKYQNNKYNILKFTVQVKHDLFERGVDGFSYFH